MDKRSDQVVSSEISTVREIVQWGLDYFTGSDVYFGHGTDQALDEVCWLVSHAMTLPPEADPLTFEGKLTPAAREKILFWFRQRVEKRIPTAYLTQSIMFAGLPFYVDERVIIPRSPIAELIGNAFAPWVKPQKVKHILDLCTGSGCIAIACAHVFPEATVDAVDVSSDALDVAKINIAQHDLAARVFPVHSDLFDALRGKTYDLIVTNPPYVNAEDLQSMPAEYHHEPELALAAGADGLAIVDRIIRHAKEYLTDHGVLIVEVGNSADAMMRKYPTVPMIWLDFEAGGEGVFLVTRDDLRKL